MNGDMHHRIETRLVQRIIRRRYARRNCGLSRSRVPAGNGVRIRMRTEWAYDEDHQPEYERSFHCLLSFTGIDSGLSESDRSYKAEIRSKLCHRYANLPTF